METKVNAYNWAELDFLINNFYEIVEYKRGRGIYGDRVILKRSKRAECIFGEKDISQIKNPTTLQRKAAEFLQAGGTFREEGIFISRREIEAVDFDLEKLLKDNQ